MYLFHARSNGLACSFELCGVGKPYPHELNVEFFAFGEEVDGNNYVLLDRQQSSFIPFKENQGNLEFYSPKPIRIQTTALRASAPMRGIKYGGYLCSHYG